MTFTRAARIADAVLLEGYVLYPYRSTSKKNRYRWTFGVLAPESWSRSGGCEESWLEAQLLVSGASPVLTGRLRFLSVVDRRVEAFDGQRYERVENLDIEGRAFVSWEEGEVREIDFDASVDGVISFEIEPSEKIEVLQDASGAVRGRIIRTQSALHGAVHVSVAPLPTPPAEAQLWRFIIRVENLTPGVPDGADRADVMRFALVSTHLLVAAEGGRFISLFDPPPHTRDVAATCRSTRCWPVLAAEEGRDDLMLASPIILYDHPQIAPESTGDFFDACEIDEILALRTRTLTDEEKVIARATDPRAAAVIDRVEAMSQEELGRLHGAIRDRPKYVPGLRVRLRLDGTKRRSRRTDAQDLLYSGCTATIHAVRKDVDGRDYLAVTIDDDPSAAMHFLKGRYHYYYPDEVEPLVEPVGRSEGAS